jgi:hypothetical protein
MVVSKPVRRVIALVGGLGVVGLGLAHRAQVWQPAYVRPLWPVYPQIAAQADRYAALARVEGATVLGNPAAQRYPDCGASFARNPWDLIAWQDRLYIGLGDSSNEGPSPNAGPVPLLTYDPAPQRFGQEARLPEEQVDRFYRLDGDLWIPGADPRQSWRWGNLYRRQGGWWWQYRTLPQTIHTYPLAKWGAALVAGVSITEAVPAGVGQAGYGSAVALSEDGGRHWRVVPLGGWRIVALLTVAGQRFAVDALPGPKLQRWLNQEQRQAFHAPLYQYLEPDRFERRPDLKAGVIFPQTPAAGQATGMMEQVVTWGDRAAYIGSFYPPGATYPVQRAYLAHSLRRGAIAVEPIPLPADGLALDLRLEGDRLEVLWAQPLADHRWRSQVWTSQDGHHWRPLVSFTAVAPARSFERLGDRRYFGLGSLTYPNPQACSPMDQVSGTLVVTPATPPGSSGEVFPPAHPPTRYRADTQVCPYPRPYGSSTDVGLAMWGSPQPSFSRSTLKNSGGCRRINRAG